MSTDLSPENEQFIEQEIATGVFRDRDEVLNAGVEFLRQRKSLLARLDEGRRQLDQGESSDYDTQGIGEYLDDVHQRGQERYRETKKRA